VLVRLLHTALYEDLPQHYLKHDTVTGDVVQESQISHQGEQSFNASRDAQALAEILQLSFVDDLINSILNFWQTCTGIWCASTLVF